MKTRRLRSATKVVLLCLIVLSGLSFLGASPSVVADSPITVEVDHEVADTWSSVLVMIRASPTIVNNTTYHVNRRIQVTLMDLDTPQELCKDDNVSLASGVAQYTFRVLPEWGEFLMSVEVFDPYTGAEEREYVTIVYSVDYIIYMMAVLFDEDLKEMDEDNEAAIAEQQNLTSMMALMLFLVLPVALLRLDHKAARQEGRSSTWDKAQDKLFNWTPVPPALYHYLEDPAYEFPAAGRRTYNERKKQYALAAVRVDLIALGRVEEMLVDELKDYEEPEPEKKPKKEEPETEEKFQKLEDEEIVDVDEDEYTGEMAPDVDQT